MAAKYIAGELGEKLLDIKGPAACDDWEGVVLRRGHAHLQDAAGHAVELVTPTSRPAAESPRRRGRHEPPDRRPRCGRRESRGAGWPCAGECHRARAGLGAHVCARQQQKSRPPMLWRPSGGPARRTLVIGRRSDCRIRHASRERASLYFRHFAGRSWRRERGGGDRPNGTPIRSLPLTERLVGARFDASASPDRPTGADARPAPALI